MIFALLEHVTGDAHTAAPEPALAAGPLPVTGGVLRAHWDFLVEGLVYERLPTWRLAANPLRATGPIGAERLPDHRRLYLDYEGEIAGGRGRVRRLDRGPARIERFEDEELVVQLRGAVLAGRFHIGRNAGGELVFERLGADESAG